MVFSATLRLWSQYCLLALLAFCILWKGGKGLETTWLLTAVAWLLTYSSWKKRHSELRVILSPVEGRSMTFFPILWWCVILFILWTILSWIFSTTRNYGLDEVLRDGSLVLIFLWIVRGGWDSCSLSQGERVRERGRNETTNYQLPTTHFFHSFVALIAWATLIACLLGLAIYTLQPVTRFVGTFFDWRFHTDYWPNAWAEFLLLSWPLFLSGYSGTRLLRYSSLGFVLGCLLLSYSRGAMIAFGGQIFLLAIFSLFTIPFRRKIILPILLIILLSLLTFISANLLRSQFHSVQDVTSKVTFTASEGTSSIDERSSFWYQAWELAKQRPVFGWGPGSFRFVQPRLQDRVLATSDHPHNVFLKLAMERGLPAAILFLAIILVVFWSFLRKAYAQKFSIFNVQCSMFIAVTGVLVHNMIDYNLQFVGIALPLWVMMGFLAAPQPGTAAPHKKTYIAAPPQFILSLAKGGCGIIKCIEILLASALLILAIWEGHYLLLSSFGRHAEAAGRGSAALEWYGTARSSLFPRDLELSRTQLLFKQTGFIEAQESIESYLVSNPEDARGWKLLGQLAIQRNDVQTAVRASNEAWRLGKWNDAGILRLYLHMLLVTKNDAQLAAESGSIDAIVRAFADAILQNTHFIALSGNVEEFLEAMKIMEQAYPDRAEEYQKLASDVEKHTAVERATWSARPVGRLW